MRDLRLGPDLSVFLAALAADRVADFAAGLAPLDLAAAGFLETALALPEDLAATLAATLPATLPGALPAT